jgi:hypothetical protein
MATSTYWIIGGIIVLVILIAVFLLEKRQEPDVAPLPPGLAPPKRRYKKQQPPKTKPSGAIPTPVAKKIKKAAKAAGKAIINTGKAAAKDAGKAAKAGAKVAKKIINNQITGPCAKYHTFPAWYQIPVGDPSKQCGTANEGGSTCKAECLQTQIKYCKGSSKDQWKCQVIDRGVPLCKDKQMCVDKKTKKSIPCPCYTLNCGKVDYQTSPKDKAAKVCGGKNKGGAACKSTCCSAQWNKSGLWSGCRTAAGGSRVQCMADRGCDVNQSSTFGSGFSSSTFCKGLDYRVAPSNSSDQKCGGYKKGSSRCKKQCCDTQWNKSPHWAGCKNVPDPVLCMKQRGCSSKDYLKKLPTFTNGKFTPLNRLEVGNHRGVYPATLCQSNLSSGGYCRECLSNSDCATGCCTGYRCKAKSKKSASTCKKDCILNFWNNKGCYNKCLTDEHCG